MLRFLAEELGFRSLSLEGDDAASAELDAYLRTGRGDPREPDAYVLDLRADVPEDVRAWLDAPTRTRLIGPYYDPDDDATYNLSGGSLAEWLVLVVHVRGVSAARLLR
ncbi:hypothetical protein [Saccharopolyspora hattusasensis]|uniref:hypothetical protein n=1 Tax=Saccharopolyspora hattusasensis TaxID=1128679 RepID=UPI003D999250